MSIHDDIRARAKREAEHVNKLTYLSDKIGIGTFNEITGAKSD